MNYPAPNSNSVKVEELLYMINVMWRACNNYEDKGVKAEDEGIEGWG